MQTLKLVKLLLEKNGNTNSLANFLKILDKNKLNYLLPNLLHSLEKIKIKDESENKEKIITAHTLSKEIRENISIKYKLNNPENIEDKNIITGFKIYTKTKIVDASLNTILKNFESAGAALSKK